MKRRGGSPRREVSRRGVVVGAIAQGTSRVVAALLGAIVAALLARGLSKAAFGEFMLATTVGTIAGAVSDFGISQAATREMAAHPEKQPGVLAAFIMVRFVVGLAAASVGWIILATVEGTSTTLVMSVCVMATLPVGAGTAFATAALAQLRSSLTTILVLLQSGLWLAAVAALTATRAGLWAYGLALLGCAIIQTTVAVMLARGHIRADFKRAWRHVRPLLGIAWPVGVGGMLVTSYYRIDALLIFQMKGARVAATYAAAYRFLDVMQFVPGTLASLVLPMLARARQLGNDAMLARLYRDSMNWMVLATAPVAAIGIAESTAAVRILYGPRYSPSGPLLAILLPAFVVIAVGYITVAYYIAQKDFYPYLTTALIGAIANVVANALLIPKFGAYAAAWATLGTEVIVGGSLAVGLQRRHGAAFPGKGAVRIVAAAGAGGLTAWVLQGNLQSLGQLPGMLLSTVCGGIAYVAAGVLTRSLPLHELWIVLRTREARRDAMAYENG